MRHLKYLILIMLLSGCGRTRVTHSYSFPTLELMVVGFVAIFCVIWLFVRIPRR